MWDHAEVVDFGADCGWFCLRCRNMTLTARGTTEAENLERR